MHLSKSFYTAVLIINDLIMPVRGHTLIMLACFRAIFDLPSTYTLVSIFTT